MRGITNAQQKNGVTTINTIAPDANNDFTIEAGTNVTITPGTNKITINSAGGGGAWTEFTGGNDWSDIFDRTNNIVTAKKDVLVFVNARNPFYGSGNIMYFIPKGASQQSSIGLPLSQSAAISTNKFRIFRSLLIGNITGTSLDMSYIDYTFTTDGSTVSISNSSVVDSLQKTKVTLYTRD